jgi:hypothetical protein
MCLPVIRQMFFLDRVELFNFGHEFTQWWNIEITFHERWKDAVLCICGGSK